jgi:hypothetical protein
VAFQLTGEESFRSELARRAEILSTDALARPLPPVGEWTQGELAAALLAADHTPPDPGRFRPDLPERLRERPPNWDPRHGLRFFGWTDGLGLPWALEALAR